MRARTAETTPLLSVNHSMASPVVSTYRKIGNKLLVTLERYNNAVNTLSLPFAITYPLLAYPDVYGKVNRISTMIGLPLCAANFALDLSASRHGKLTCQGKSLETESMKYKVSLAVSGTNTFNFTLGINIAVYIALYAAVNKIGEDEVDVSNLAYILGFIATSASIGIARVCLDANKKSWENKNTRLAKFLNGTHISIETLHNAGNLNAFMLFFLSFADIGESGKMNPYERLGLFGTALSMGIMLQYVSHRYQRAVKPINTILDTTSTTNYLSMAFTGAARDAYTDDERTALTATFTILAAAALLSSVVLPEKSEVAEHDVEAMNMPVEQQDVEAMNLQVVQQEAEAVHALALPSVAPQAVIFQQRRGSLDSNTAEKSAVLSKARANSF